MSMYSYLLCRGPMGREATPRGILLPRGGGGIMTFLSPLFNPLLALATEAIPLVKSTGGGLCCPPWSTPEDVGGVIFLMISLVLMGPGGDDKMNG